MKAAPLTEEVENTPQSEDEWIKQVTGLDPKIVRGEVLRLATRAGGNPWVDIARKRGNIVSQCSLIFDHIKTAMGRKKDYLGLTHYFSFLISNLVSWKVGITMESSNEGALVTWCLCFYSLVFQILSYYYIANDYCRKLVKDSEVINNFGMVSVATKALSRLQKDNMKEDYRFNSDFSNGYQSYCKANAPLHDALSGFFMKTGAEVIHNVYIAASVIASFVVLLVIQNIQLPLFQFVLLLQPAAAVYFMKRVDKGDEEDLDKSPKLQR